MGGDAGERERPAGADRCWARGGRSHADGFPIPERFKEQLGRFDTNNDGKLSDKEIDAMPEAARERVKSVIQGRLGGGTGSEKP